MLIEQSHAIEQCFNTLPSQHGPLVLEALLAHTVKPMVQDRLSADLTIFVADSPEKIEEVKAFRLKYYRYSLNYMLGEIDANGGDHYDEYSKIYCVKYKNRIVASIRLTPYPYESLEHIDSKQLSTFLGPNWRKYLEWNRLLIHPGFQARGILQALIAYAGIHSLLSCEQSMYFGYSTATVRHLFSHFDISQETIKFKIGRRGNQDYHLLKGHFLEDFMHFKQQYLG